MSKPGSDIPKRPNQIEVDTPLGKTVGAVEAEALRRKSEPNYDSRQAENRTILALCAALRSAHEQLVCAKVIAEQTDKIDQERQQLKQQLREAREEIERLKAELEAARKLAKQLWRLRGEWESVSNMKDLISQQEACIREAREEIERLTAERDAARAWRTEQQTAFADPESIAREAFEKTREAAAIRSEEGRTIPFVDRSIRALAFEEVFGDQH